MTYVVSQAAQKRGDAAEATRCWEDLAYIKHHPRKGKYLSIIKDENELTKEAVRYVHQDCSQARNIACKLTPK